MNKKELEYFKKKLLEEQKELQEELGGISRQNPDNPKDWQATAGDMEVDPADENELADKLEELEGNTGVVNQLEKQLNEVRDALDRIQEGKYGVCEMCGKPIEKERLEANPSARISIKHKH